MYQNSGDWGQSCSEVHLYPSKKHAWNWKDEKKEHTNLRKARGTK